MTRMPLDYESPIQHTAHSRAGVASLVLGSFNLGVLILSMYVGTQRGMGGPLPEWLIVLLFVVFICLVCPVLGAAFGVVGLYGEQGRRMTAGVGLCLNVLVLLVLGFAIVNML